MRAHPSPRHVIDVSARNAAAEISSKSVPAGTVCRLCVIAVGCLTNSVRMIDRFLTLIFRSKMPWRTGKVFSSQCMRSRARTTRPRPPEAATAAAAV